MKFTTLLIIASSIATIAAVPSGPISENLENPTSVSNALLARAKGGKGAAGAEGAAGGKGEKSMSWAQAHTKLSDIESNGPNDAEGKFKQAVLQAMEIAMTNEEQFGGKGLKAGKGGKGKGKGTEGDA